jgi:hypothetical protein
VSSWARQHNSIQECPFVKTPVKPCRLCQLCYVRPSKKDFDRALIEMEFGMEHCGPNAAACLAG